MDNILIKETWVNEDQNCINGCSEVYETYTDNIGDLFRTLQCEYGKCTSKMYIDLDNVSHAIGWVFEKIAHYTDTREPYKLVTWVELHNSRPVTTIENDYRFI